MLKRSISWWLTKAAKEDGLTIGAGMPDTSESTRNAFRRFVQEMDDVEFERFINNLRENERAEGQRQEKAEQLKREWDAKRETKEEA